MALGDERTIKCICCQSPFLTIVGGRAACPVCSSGSCESCVGFIR